MQISWPWLRKKTLSLFEERVPWLGEGPNARPPVLPRDGPQQARYRQDARLADFHSAAFRREAGLERSNSKDAIIFTVLPHMWHSPQFH